MHPSSELKSHPAVPEHDASLYRYDRTADGIAGLDALGDAEVERFHEDGFVVVRDAFSPAEVSAAIDGLMHLIGGGNPEFRTLQFEANAPENVRDLDAEGRWRWLRKLMWFADHDARLHALAHHPRLLTAVERLIGEGPVLFQEMALLKPAGVGAEKPWHQDCAYFDIALDKPVVGVWIALDDAGADNGCMHVIPGSHRQGPQMHFQVRDWQICDRDVPTERDVMVPLAPGGALLFHGLLWHGTPVNRSQRPRRALQFHYKPESVGSISRTERMQRFGGADNDLDC